MFFCTMSLPFFNIYLFHKITLHIFHQVKPTCFAHTPGRKIKANVASSANCQDISSLKVSNLCHLQSRMRLDSVFGYS